jgi:hypothetical protein
MIGCSDGGNVPAVFPFAGVGGATGAVVASPGCASVATSAVLSARAPSTGATAIVASFRCASVTSENGLRVVARERVQPAIPVAATNAAAIVTVILSRAENTVDVLP